jgi:hypothetical protein
LPTSSPGLNPALPSVNDQVGPIAAMIQLINAGSQSSYRSADFFDPTASADHIAWRPAIGLELLET